MTCGAFRCKAPASALVVRPGGTYESPRLCFGHATERAATDDRYAVRIAP